MNPVPVCAEPSKLTRQTADGIFIHELADDLPGAPAGPFVRLPGGTIFAVAALKGESANAFRSADEGATWEQRPLLTGDEVSSAPTGALLVSREGTIVVAFANLARKNWNWNDELRDASEACLPTCVMRSEDGGESWKDLQTLHDEWTGATRNMIQTRDGRIVFTTMQFRQNPGRHTCMTYGSDDDGRTWEASNVLDLGGNGHHDGVTEATIVELNDGRILKYLRTNWGYQWRAESCDGGRHWHPFGPTAVPCSSTPAMLTRLQSGRVVLVWNRPFPEGEQSYPLRGGDGVWSATPASNYREELSISFSDDECETWSPSVVIARNPGSEVCYPYVFEQAPGALWITAHRWGLRMKLREDDFLR